MQLLDLSENLIRVALAQVDINQLANKIIHRRSLLLLDRSALWRINIVHGVLDEHTFGLPDVLH